MDYVKLGMLYKKPKISAEIFFFSTVIIVSGQIFPIDEEVVVFVQFPELAVDDVKMFVAEEVRNLVDVFLLQKNEF